MRYTETEKLALRACQNPRVPSEQKAAAQALIRAAQFLEQSGFDNDAACLYLRDMAAARVVRIPPLTPVLQIAPAGGVQNNTGSSAACIRGDELTPERRLAGERPAQLLRRQQQLASAVYWLSVASLSAIAVSALTYLLGVGE